VCLASSSRWHSPSSSQRCHRELFEEGEKAEGGGGGAVASSGGGLSPAVAAAARVRGGGFGGGGGSDGALRQRRLGRQLVLWRAGMEGWSDRGMKTHEEDKVAGRSCDRGTQFTSTHIT
jgi:hypothetical protein